MSSDDQPRTPSKRSYRKWAVNLIILVAVTVFMLALAEITLRWIDGYDLFNVELEQDNATIQSTE
jgi:hypothetical protein